VQKTPSSQSNPEQKGNTGSTTIPDIKLCYRAKVTKTEWDWHKNQWNRIDPDINLHSCGHLTFGKGANNICQRKDTLFNKWCLGNGYIEH
jgi:hypothetical protein